MQCSSNLDKAQLKHTSINSWKKSCVAGQVILHRNNIYKNCTFREVCISAFTFVCIWLLVPKYSVSSVFVRRELIKWAHLSRHNWFRNKSLYQCVVKTILLKTYRQYLFLNVFFNVGTFLTVFLSCKVLPSFIGITWFSWQHT